MPPFNRNERAKGIIGYIIAVVIANYLNILLSKYSTLTIEQSTFISIYIVGNVIIYSSDILFAKEKFKLKEYNGIVDYYGKVPYTDLPTRAKWLGSSLIDKYFFRFLITVVIDTIIGITLLKYAIKEADRLKFLTKWKYRNYLLVFIIAIFTYILYVSTLRFSWAYQHEENDIVNMLVVIWASLAVLVISTRDYKTISYRRDTKWRNMY